MPLRSGLSPGRSTARASEPKSICSQRHTYATSFSPLRLHTIVFSVGISTQRQTFSQLRHFVASRPNPSQCLLSCWPLAPVCQILFGRVCLETTFLNLTLFLSFQTHSSISRNLCHTQVQWPRLFPAAGVVAPLTATARSSSELMTGRLIGAFLCAGKQPRRHRGLCRNGAVNVQLALAHQPIVFSTRRSSCLHVCVRAGRLHQETFFAHRSIKEHRLPARPLEFYLM